MREVNVTELRNHLPRYLSSVQKGTEILITSHGHVIARILPPADTRSEAVQQLRLLRKRCKIGDIISPVNESWNADK
jgi:prevent-host-death family protein